MDSMYARVFVLRLSIGKCTIAAWKQATRDFVPPAEIGMKLAAFGLVRLDGDVRQHVFLDYFDY